MKDQFTRDWIIEKSLEIVDRYKPGDLTIRALHYQLVGEGMTNTMQHYKRVVAAMEVARWDGRISFDTFSDLDRTMVGETKGAEVFLEDEINSGKRQVEAWMTHYSKNRWENQPNYVELFIEKKALQNVFEPVCSRFDVGLGAVKGYPSLTFLHETAERFKNYPDKNLIILYFGDYDPSGEDIPRSIQDNLQRMGIDVEVRRFALFLDQVQEWNLPAAPAKVTDSRTANWDGIGQVELDAVKPEKLREMARDAILSVFDYELHDALLEVEKVEKEQYVAELKRFVTNL